MKLNYKLSPSNVFQKEKNTKYLSPVIVTSLKDFKQICEHDYVCGEFKENTRSNSNFISTNCLVMDLDNDHSENPKDWLTVDDIKNEFLNVPFLVHYSRNHLKEKRGKAPRPKFHVIFPCNEITSFEELNALKEKLLNYFPLFDDGAKDAARFIFGSKDAKVDYIDGTTLIDDFIRNDEESIEFLLNDEKPILEGSRNTTMHKIACNLLKRYGLSDTSIKAYYKQSNRCEPRLEESELKTIWNSASRFYENKISKQPGYISPDKYNNPTSVEDVEFDELMPLKPAKLMDFPLDALPIVIKNYVEAVSESIQAPIDMAAICALGSLSTAMQKRYRVKVKKDWIEQINLFLLLVAPSSERKSPVFKQFTDIIQDYVDDYNKKNALKFKISNEKKRRLKITYDKMLKAKVGKYSDEEIDKAYEEYELFATEKELSLLVDNSTTEALTKALANNNGSISLLSSEGGFLDIISDLYCKNTNIDVLLKAYSGDSIQVDRIKNDEAFVIRHPILTMLLTIQPNVAKEFISNKKFAGKGLCARFLYSYPNSRIGTRTYDSPEINEAYREKFNKLITEILDEDRSETKFITLDEGAHEVNRSFYESVESNINNKYKYMDTWAGKIVGNTLRIAGILARAENSFYSDFLGDIKKTSDPDDDLVITKEIMQNAIKIANYFIEHAEYTFYQMDDTSLLKICQDVIAIIKKNNFQPTVNVRKLKKKSKIFEERYQEVLDKLELHGYLVLKEVDKNAKGRPPIDYWVNPLIFKEDEVND